MLGLLLAVCSPTVMAGGKVRVERVFAGPAVMMGFAAQMGKGVSASPFSEVHRLERLVGEENACALPGVSLVYERFLPIMWRAVATGHVRHEAASFVAQGLRWGFTAGIQPDKMVGHRHFKNYQSSLDARTQVTAAVVDRVSKGKTLDLGVATAGAMSALKGLYRATACFPMGGAPKWPEWWKVRPTDDHTRTGLNAASDLSQLRHKLTAYEDIASWLRQDYFMRVSDVADAYPLLPLSPTIWPFLFFRFFVDDTEDMHLLLHITGDFGAAGMPGVFKIFFTDVVVGMARAGSVLTQKFVVYVDDCGAIGPSQSEVDADMLRFHAWAEPLGVFFKALKDRAAAIPQLMIGFWWDSRTLTRTLETRKIEQYLEMMDLCSHQRKLSLVDMQKLAGRMQRCIMTFPPGAACLLVSLFGLMSGLRLPWHQRRTSRGVREDIRAVRDLLALNLGKGFYSFANFEWGPEVRTDASKSARKGGGGYVSNCGRYSFWHYGSRALRKLIDYLEGDTVVQALRELGHLWRGRVVVFKVDNSAFQKSARKGRSRVERLNSLIKEILAYCIFYGCILVFEWISSEDNLLADQLSRDKESEFLTDVYRKGFWAADVIVRRRKDAGSVRTLPERRGELDRAALEKGEFALADALPNDPEGEFVPQVSDPWLVWFRDKACQICGLAYRTSTCEHDPCCGAWKCPRHGCPGGQPCVCEEPVTQAKEETCAPVRAKRRASSAPRIRPSSVLSLAVLALSIQSVEPAPTNSHDASVSYARTSIFSGLPYHLVSQVEEVLDNRLSTSSWRSVSSAMKVWREVCLDNQWPVIILTDDPDRGGKMVTFLMHMAADTALTWVSIQNYFWGMRTWQTLQHQSDPAKGTEGLTTFLKGLKVLTWVASEPRKRVTREEIEWMIDNCDLTCFRNVQLLFLVLVCLNTFTRTECPCPKTHTGRDKYEYKVHFSVSDFDVQRVAGAVVLAVRFWVIKQDQRLERPEVRAESASEHMGDWVYVADIPDSKWSIFTWYARLQSFHEARDPKSPMFLDPSDMSRAYTYPQYYKDFVHQFDLMGSPRKGPHGLRVQGYKQTRDALGEAIAVAQGGWQSTGHHRYNRVTMEQVLRIPLATSGQLGVTPAPNTAMGEARPAGPPAERLQRSDLRRQLGEPVSDGEHEQGDGHDARDPRVDHPSLLPPGWATVRHEGPHLSRSYSTFEGPDGQRAQSRAAAWRAYEDASYAGAASAADDPEELDDEGDALDRIDYVDSSLDSSAGAHALSRAPSPLLSGPPEPPVAGALVDSVALVDDVQGGPSEEFFSLLLPSGGRMCGTPGCGKPDRHRGPCVPYLSPRQPRGERHRSQRSGI